MQRRWGSIRGFEALADDNYVVLVNRKTYWLLFGSWMTPLLGLTAINLLFRSREVGYAILLGIVAVALGVAAVVFISKLRERLRRPPEQFADTLYLDVCAGILLGSAGEPLSPLTHVHVMMRSHLFSDSTGPAWSLLLRWRAGEREVFRSNFRRDVKEVCRLLEKYGVRAS